MFVIRMSSLYWFWVILSENLGIMCNGVHPFVSFERWFSERKDNLHNKTNAYSESALKTRIGEFELGLNPIHSNCVFFKRFEFELVWRIPIVNWGQHQFDTFVIRIIRIDCEFGSIRMALFHSNCIGVAVLLLVDDHFLVTTRRFNYQVTKTTFAASSKKNKTGYSSFLSY